MNMLIWAIQVAGLNRAKIRDVAGLPAAALAGRHRRHRALGRASTTWATSTSPGCERRRVALLLARGLGRPTGYIPPRDRLNRDADRGDSAGPPVGAPHVEPTPRGGEAPPCRASGSRSRPGRKVGRQPTTPYRTGTAAARLPGPGAGRARARSHRGRARLVRPGRPRPPRVRRRLARRAAGPRGRERAGGVPRGSRSPRPPGPRTRGGGRRRAAAARHESGRGRSSAASTGRRPTSPCRSRSSPTSAAQPGQHRRDHRRRERAVARLAAALGQRDRGGAGGGGGGGSGRRPRFAVAASADSTSRPRGARGVPPRAAAIGVSHPSSLVELAPLEDRICRRSPPGSLRDAPAAPSSCWRRLASRAAWLVASSRRQASAGRSSAGRRPLGPPSRARRAPRPRACSPRSSRRARAAWGGVRARVREAVGRGTRRGGRSRLRRRAAGRGRGAATPASTAPSCATPSGRSRRGPAPRAP